MWDECCRGKEIPNPCTLREFAAGIQVIQILPAPAEGLPFRVLDAARVHSAILQDTFMLGSEVFAYDRDYADVSEVAGGEREIGGRAADDVVRATGRSGNVIEGYGTYGQYAHINRRSGVLSFTAGAKAQIGWAP